MGCPPLNRPAPFRKQDVGRAIKAAKSSGLSIARIEIEASKIVVVVGEAPDEPPPENPWHKAKVHFSQPRNSRVPRFSHAVKRQMCMFVGVLVLGDEFGESTVVFGTREKSGSVWRSALA